MIGLVMAVWLLCGAFAYASWEARRVASEPDAKRKRELEMGYRLITMKDIRERVQDLAEGFRYLMTVFREAGVPIAAYQQAVYEAALREWQIYFIGGRGFGRSEFVRYNQEDALWALRYSMGVMTPDGSGQVSGAGVYEAQVEDVEMIQYEEPGVGRSEIVPRVSDGDECNCGSCTQRRGDPDWDPLEAGGYPAPVVESWDDATIVRFDDERIGGVIRYYLERCWRCDEPVDRRDEVGLCQECKTTLQNL